MMRRGMGAGVVLAGLAAGCADGPDNIDWGALHSRESVALVDRVLEVEGRATRWQIGALRGTEAVARYEGGAGAAEQGYVLAGPTDMVWTPLPGRSVALSDGSLWVRGGNDALRVSGLRAWDATGRPVPSRLVAGPGGFGAEFDDAGAAYPITVDPYLAPQATWTRTTTQGNAAAGVSVAFGDFNGDGAVDGVVGQPGWDGLQFSVGAVQVHYDLAGGGPTQTLEGADAYGWFGFALLVRDTDGDGADELFVGAPGASGVLGSEGAVFEFVGGGPELTAGGSWFGHGTDGEFGAALGWLDDIDGDGLDEIGVGAPEEGLGGVVHLIEPGDPSATAVVLAGAQPGGRFGAAVVGGADLDGDGLADLVVGAPHAAGLGGLYLFSGGLGAPVLTWSALGSEAGSGLGTALAVLDLDASGAADLVAGAPGAASGKGRINVYVDGPGSGLVAVQVAPTGNGGLGSALATGDLDGDGLSDLLVGRPGSGTEDAPLTGGLTVIAGGPGAPGLAPNASISGTVGYGQLGTSLAVADVDGDGLADALVGGFLATTTGSVQAGAAWLLPGLPGTADVDGDGFCADTGPCGVSVPGGDCDDTLASVFPGAPEACDGRDTDCDGVVPTGELDSDGDGSSPCDGDCSEGDPAIHPQAPEQCDSVDHDCDGLPNNDVEPAPRFADVDEDGFGAGEATGFSCAPLSPGQSAVDSDCDDGDPAVFPGAVETECNGIDDDCAPLTPDAYDQDGDGVLPCDDCTRVGGAWTCGDCDDAEARVHPRARENCEDGIDQDCDGLDEDCEVPPPCLEPDRRCEEPAGCAQGGGGAGLGWLLLLLGWCARRRSRAAWSALAVSLLGLAPALAWGQASWDADGRLDTQLLRPSFAPWGFVGSTGADPGLGGTVVGGVISQYEYAPMVLRDDGDEIARILRHRVTHTVGTWLVPIDRLGFGLALPLVFHEADWEQGDWSLVGATLGDLEVDALYRLVRSGSAALSVGGRLYLPTSKAHSLAGEALPRVEGRLAAQGSVGPLTGLIEMRALLRRRLHTGYDLDLAPEFALLGAVRVWPVPGRLQVAVEVESRASSVAFLKRGAENPVDLRALVRLHPASWLTVEMGGGLGLNSGYGAPRARGLFGVTVRRLPEGRDLAEPFAFAQEPPSASEPIDEIADVDLLDEPDVFLLEVDESEPELATEEPGPLAEVTEEQIVIHAPIEFAYDSDELLPSSLPVLTEVATLLEASPELAHVLVEGHASLEGRTTYNWDLSNRRAASVFRWLVEFGVSSVRLSYRGMGEAVPRDASTGSVLVRERDRRVEFHIVERLDPLLDHVPDWGAEAPPIPWLMDEAEEVRNED